MVILVMTTGNGPDNLFPINELHEFSTREHLLTVQSSDINGQSMPETYRDEIREISSDLQIG